MDKGSWANSGIRIFTYKFSRSETEFLIILLKELYNLNCTIQTLKVGTKSFIYKKKSVSKLIKIVLPYMDLSMYHKLGIII